MSVYVRCEVSDGLRKKEATVMVNLAEGGVEYMPVDRCILLSAENGPSYMPVHIVIDYDDEDRVQVGLPVESDSGKRRLWVPRDSLKEFQVAVQ